MSVADISKRKLICGVGINDSKESVVVDGVTIPVYNRWKAMIRRCYSVKSHKIRPTYIGCTVCDLWLHFTEFEKWHNEHHTDGWHLDKDLFDTANTEYSPINCYYVPLELNSLFTDCGRARGVLPLGVYKCQNKYRAQLSINKQRVYLGAFITPEEAHDAWVIAKRKHVMSELDRYRSEHPNNKRLMFLLDKIEAELHTRVK